MPRLRHGVCADVASYEQFSFDITDAIQSGGSDNEVIVHVYDPSDEGFQPNGKQRISAITNPGGDTYTPSSGIWQTVWAEFVPKNYVQHLRIEQSMTSAVVTVTAATAGSGVTIDVMDEGTVVGTFTGKAGSPITLKPPSPVKLWQPYTQGDPFLYTMTVKLETGDEVGSYFGLRSVSLVRYCCAKCASVSYRCRQSLGSYSRGLWLAIRGVVVAPPGHRYSRSHRRHGTTSRCRPTRE